MKHEKAELQCQFCGHCFKRTLSRFEYKCPKCGEYDVMPTSVFGKKTKKELDEHYENMFKDVK